jgi:hypothetical protein
MRPSDEVLEITLLELVHPRYKNPDLAAKIEIAKSKVNYDSGLKRGQSIVGNHIMKVFKDGSVVYQLMGAKQS